MHLDEPFEPPNPALDAAAERVAMVDELLAHLQAEMASVDVNTAPSFYDASSHDASSHDASSYEEKRRMLRALLTMRGPDPLPAWFHGQMDRVLQYEAFERGLTDAASLPRVAQAMPESVYSAASHCAVWRGDITTLKVDAIVNAANAPMLGCFQPFHACIDNVIHSAAGPRVREDCHDIVQRQCGTEGTGRAKVTRAYNLPAKYILHTVGPIVGHGHVLPAHEGQLAACYRSCLDLALRVSAIRSVAFCCISTGVFGFPQKPAARIALRTVDQWLARHPGALDLVVFNVFRADDLEIYERLLCGR